MKILFDDQIFGWQKFGGISRYFAELFPELERLGAEVECLVPISDNAYFNEGFATHLLQGTGSPMFRKCARLLSSAINRPTSIAQLIRNRFDVFHPTYYNPYFLTALRRPFVLTVHDMTHEIYPEMFWDAAFVTAQKKLLCERASKIIAISESTKRDLLHLYGISPHKIELVPHAAAFSYATIKKDVKASLPESYLLFVGSRKGYKNFPLFFQAVAPLLQKNRSLHVVCTASPFTESELALFEAHGVLGQMQQVFVEEDAFYTLYHCATAFVFPSLYEGFGIPTLEAFLAGCPTLLSRSSSMPEVGGNAALYFDPNSVEDLRQTLERLLSDDSLRERLREAGYQRVKNYTWEETARLTAKVYAAVL